MFTWSTLCPRWLKSRVSKCILDLGNSCWQQQDSLFCQCLWTKRDETVFLARETKQDETSCNINIKTSAWLSCFQQNASLHQFEEQPVERLFPELQQLPSKLVPCALFALYLSLFDCVWCVNHSFSLCVNQSHDISYFILKSWLKRLFHLSYKRMLKLNPPIAH